MNGIKILSIVLIVVGILALVFGSFSFTEQTHEANVGPIELVVKDKKTVNVPVWAGVGAIVVWAGLWFFASRRKQTPSSPVWVARPMFGPRIRGEPAAAREGSLFLRVR